jgi:hypothetical protein
MRSRTNSRRHELGGACCVDRLGEHDTMVVVHSGSKGAAMTLAIAHSRGWLDYEERVATYAGVRKNGKEQITMRLDFDDPR